MRYSLLDEAGQSRCRALPSGVFEKYLIDHNIITMSPDDIEQWLRDIRLEGIWDEWDDRAEVISAKVGIDIGAGEFREIAKQLRLRADIAEATELGIYNEDKPWRAALRHHRALQEVLETDEDTWIATNKISWENEKAVRARYQRLLKEAQKMIGG